MRAKMFNKRAKKNSEQIFKKLEINSNDIIADIGSGGGYYSYRFAEIADKGRVYCLDTNEKFLQFIDKNINEKGLENIKTIHIKESIKLPEIVDLIFIRNVYHHLENRVEYFKDLKKYLKSNGRLAIVEWEKSLFMSHGTKKETILNELKNAGYKLEKDYDIPKQSFLIFQKT